MTEITAELLALAKKEQHYIVKRGKSLGRNNYTLIDAKGKVERHLQEMCYGGLNRTPWGATRDQPRLKPLLMVDNSIIASPTGNWEGRAARKSALKYIDWWANRSFVAAPFLTKDAEEIFELGAVFDCNFPASYIVTAGIGLRYINEFPQTIRNWLEFSKHINADAAIFLAHYFYRQADSPPQTEWICYGSREQWHTWIGHGMGRGAMQKAIAHAIPHKPLPSMEERIAHRPLASLWYGPRLTEQTKDKDLLFTPFKRTKKRELVKDAFGLEVKAPYSYAHRDRATWLKETVELNIRETP